MIDHLKCKTEENSQSSINMKNVFPDFIMNFPLADIPVEGLTAYLGQGDRFQVAFFHFEKDTHVPEHSHGEQLEIVLEGQVEVRMKSKTSKYKRGDRFFVPAGELHSAFVHKGYCSLAIFNQADRYKRLQ
jgi:quercetin dioxygenase-like cupin family protein